MSGQARKIYSAAIAILLMSPIAPMVLAYPAVNAATSEPSDRRTTPEQLAQQANQLYQAGQVEAAVQTWQQARTIYQQLHDQAGEAGVLANLGAAYIALEQYPKAIAALEAFLPLAPSLKNQHLEAEAFSNLGIAHKALGNYSKALEFQKQAGRVLRAIGDRQGLGQVLVNLGNVFEALGDYDNATAAYQQGMKLAQQTGDRVGEAIALSNLGGVYANREQYDQAIAELQQSLTISQAINDRSGQASTLINLGSAYHSLGDLTKARQNYQQALDLAQTSGDRQRVGEAFGSLGLVYEDLKDYPKAIAAHQKSLAIAQALDDSNATGTALNNLGHTLMKAGQLGEAEQQLRNAIALLEKLRSPLNDSYSISLFDTQVFSYNLLTQILVAQNRLDAALEASEQSRARAFIKLLASKRASQNGQSPLSLNLPDTALSIDQIRRIAHEQQATLVQYTIIPDDQFKFRGKQRGQDAELLIWVVKPTGQVALRRQDLRSLHEPLADLVKRSRQSIGVATRGIIFVVPKDTGNQDLGQSQLQQLYDLLIQPIADLLPTNPSDRVIFIPQESLFLVPFVALQDQAGKYLIEQHTVLTAPAIQVLQLIRQPVLSSRKSFSSSPNSKAVLIVGNPTMPMVTLQPGQAPVQLPPLPGAEEEATAIARLFKVPAITGNQATKTNILSQVSQAKIIHLATHGLLEYGQGEGSQDLDIPGAIALAPSGSDDGLLTAREILDLKLNADLVILSACDTGQGRISGDGVIGLSRSLLSAGVPSVIVSLWAVPDAPTAELMVNFYRNWQSGQLDKAQALRQAMLTTMSQHSDPRDWAAFTLIGEP